VDLHELCRISFAPHDLQKSFLSRVLEQQFLPIVVAPGVFVAAQGLYTSTFFFFSVTVAELVIGSFFCCMTTMEFQRAGKLGFKLVGDILQLCGFGMGLYCRLGF
jgi:hypothetical protein